MLVPRLQLDGPKSILKQPSSTGKSGKKKVVIKLPKGSNAAQEYHLDQESRNTREKTTAQRVDLKQKPEGGSELTSSQNNILSQLEKLEFSMVSSVNGMKCEGYISPKNETKIEEPQIPLDDNMDELFALFKETEHILQSETPNQPKNKNMLTKLSRLENALQLQMQTIEAEIEKTVKNRQEKLLANEQEIQELKEQLENISSQCNDVNKGSSYNSSNTASSKLTLIENQITKFANLPIVELNELKIKQAIESLCNQQHKQLEQLRANIEIVQEDFQTWNQMLQRNSHKKTHQYMESVCWIGLLVLVACIFLVAMIPNRRNALLPT